MRQLKERAILFKFFALLLPVFGLFLCLTPAHADSFARYYDITIRGFGVGKVKVKGELKDSEYRVGLETSTSGLISLFTSVKGTARASGRVKKATLFPKNYALNLVIDGKPRNTEIQFEKNRVKKFNSDPKLVVKPTHVPVNKAELVDVIDPMSMVVFPRIAQSRTLSKEDCNRKTSVYEGGHLFDIVFRFAKFETLTNTGGIVADTVVCKGHLIYRGGHKKGGGNRSKEVITAWMTPVANAKLLMPFQLEIKLKSGLLSFKTYYASP